MEKLTLQETFNKARYTAKTTSPKATFIFDRVVSKDKREYLNLSYAYLRWIDDIVDDPKIELTEKVEFIKRQKQIIKSYQDKSLFEPQTTEEYYIYYFI
jgi:phytoene/squalene synthetase